MKAYLEPKEIQLLENAATSLRDRLLVRVLFHLGCRITEVLNLTVHDVDFTMHTVIIKHLKTRLKLSCPDCGSSLGRKHSFCPHCGRPVKDAVAKELQHPRRRILPIDEGTLNLLRDYIERGGPVLKDNKRLIFGINRHRAWQIIRDCALRAGLPKLVNSETGRVHNVSPHRLRDAFAVHAVKVNDSGDGLRLLQQYLGHASFNTTAKYRKVSGEEEQAWYQRLWEKDES